MVLYWQGYFIGTLLIISLSIRMTSGNQDTFHPVTDEEKELEMLTVTSNHTLKRGNKKCGNEEVFRLLNDSINSDINEY